MNSVFSQNKKSHIDSRMFLDSGIGIARYDMIKYPHIDKITEKQLGFFWRPEEVDISKDKIDYNQLTDYEKHIFTSNLKRQILLDSVQGRSPNLAFLPIASIPELEILIETWAFFETIHSKSYTHIIRNIYPNPSIVFDEMMDIKEIVDCSNDITRYYDSLIRYAKLYDLLGEGIHTINDNEYDISTYELKKKLWLCLNSVNFLEGIRFYISFACSWAFAELKKMEGNAKIIKFIARDENTHLAASQYIIKTLIKDDPEFDKIKQESEKEVLNMFNSVVNQEKEWANYLFKNGSMIGLNEKLLSDYVEWIAAKRIKTLGYQCPFSVSKSNPLPWTEKWLGGSSVQVAPQETEISSYIIGGVKQNVSSDGLRELSL